MGKNEKNCDHVSIKEVLQIQNLPAPPTRPFLRFAFAIANLLVSQQWREIDPYHELSTCNMILIVFFLT